MYTGEQLGFNLQVFSLRHSIAISRASYIRLHTQWPRSTLTSMCHGRREVVSSIVEPPRILSHPAIFTNSFQNALRTPVPPSLLRFIGQARVSNLLACFCSAAATSFWSVDDRHRTGNSPQNPSKTSSLFAIPPDAMNKVISVALIFVSSGEIRAFTEFPPGSSNGYTCFLQTVRRLVTSLYPDFLRSITAFLQCLSQRSLN